MESPMPDNLSPDIQFMRMALRQAQIAAEETERVISSRA